LEIETTDNKACIKKLESSLWKDHLRQSGNGGKLLVDIARNEIPLLVRQLVEMDVQILSLKPVNSLEAYFLTLTKEKAYVEAGTN
jgi:hypothetical protein